MSWLLVALIPVLLMLATFGLERVESGLNRDTVTSSDVAKFFEHAEASDVDTLARDGMSHALDRLRRRQHAEGSIGHRPPVATGTPGLPTRRYVHHGANPEFQPTRHADRV